MDFVITQIPNDNTESILENCKAIHHKIKKFDATKSASQVAVFALFIKMQELFQIPSKFPNVKQFYQQFRDHLECRSNTAFSKYKRECKCVHNLVEILGKAGASLMSFYITIHLLENAQDSDWNLILLKLEVNDLLKAFFNTIKQDKNEILPVFISGN